MSSAARNDGGPAFPVPGLSSLPNGEFLHPINGMTLRDYFAAKAMQAGLAGACLPGLDSGNPASLEAVQEAAVAFYVIADAMLAAREAA